MTNLVLNAEARQKRKIYNDQNNGMRKWKVRWDDINGCLR